MKFSVLPLIAAGVFASCAPAPKPVFGTPTASSTLADASNRYDASKLTDGTAASWCEGESGPGLGATITIPFKTGKEIRELHIQNGFGTQTFWGPNNRVRALEVSSGKATREVTLTDTGTPQKVAFKPISGSSITLKIKSVYKGSQYDDTCLAEISVAPISGLADETKAFPAGGVCSCVGDVIGTGARPDPGIKYHDFCFEVPCTEARVHQDTGLAECKPATCSSRGFGSKCKRHDEEVYIKRSGDCPTP